MRRALAIVTAAALAPGCYAVGLYAEAHAGVASVTPLQANAGQPSGAAPSYGFTVGLDLDYRRSTNAAVGASWHWVHLPGGATASLGGSELRFAGVSNTLSTEDRRWRASAAFVFSPADRGYAGGEAYLGFGPQWFLTTGQSIALSAGPRVLYLGSHEATDYVGWGGFARLRYVIAFNDEGTQP